MKMNPIKETKQNFKCQICSTYFNISSKTFLDHLKTHVTKQNAAKACKCDLCGENFISQEDLETHLKKNHISNRILKCKICEKSFPTNYRLNFHFRLVHQSDRM